MLGLEAPAAASKYVELHKERVKVVAEHIRIGRAWLNGEMTTEDTISVLEKVQNDLSAKDDEIDKFIEAYYEGKMRSLFSCPEIGVGKAVGEE